MSVVSFWWWRSPVVMLFVSFSWRRRDILWLFVCIFLYVFIYIFCLFRVLTLKESHYNSIPLMNNICDYEGKRVFE